MRPTKIISLVYSFGYERWSAKTSPDSRATTGPAPERTANNSALVLPGQNAIAAWPIYNWIDRDYPGYFRLPAYKNFVPLSQKLVPTMNNLLQSLLATDSPVRFVYSGQWCQVCKKVRAGRHRVARGAAAWGKNHQDWHLWLLQLHAAVDGLNRLCAIDLTPANAHRQPKSIRQPG